VVNLNGVRSILAELGGTSHARPSEGTPRERASEVVPFDCAIALDSSDELNEFTAANRSGRDELFSRDIIVKSKSLEEALGKGERGGDITRDRSLGLVVTKTGFPPLWGRIF